MSTDVLKNLELENAELRERLADAESVLQAIRRGEIDAVVIGGVDCERVYTLESADEAYRALVESMNEGAVTLSLDGVVLYANRRLGALLGIPTERVIGTRLADWIAQDEVAQLEAMICNTKERGASGELTLTGGTNGPLPVHGSFSPLMLQGERFCCAIISDLSLAKHHAALQTAAEQIRKVNEQLREADQRKDEFLATLAHELRNPLAPIRSAAQVLKMIEHDDMRLIRARDIIERQAGHMARLIDDLLELSRITLGRIDLKRRTEGLVPVLANAADAMRAAAPPGLTFSVEIADEPLYVHIDAMRLSQAVSNVLENAMKYTPEGGRVWLRAGRERDQAVISVQDTGIGIEPAFAQRVFEMFAQDSGDGPSARGGLGIGLALTQRLVELHDGTIEVDSPGRGKGATFTIRLPLVKSPTTEAPSSESVDTAGPASQGVLVVDDNVDAAESLRALLELSGHRVKTAYGGKEALETFDEFRPDLVLLDIGLPDLDGYEVARRFRAHYGAACPFLVALSGWGQEEDRKRAAEAGIDAYYTKPINPAALTRLLTEQAHRQN